MSTRSSRPLLALVLTACTGPSPEDGAGDVPADAPSDRLLDSGTPAEPPAEEVPGQLAVSGALAPLVDSLATESAEAVPLSAVATLHLRDDGVHFHDEATGELVALGATHHRGGLHLDSTDYLLILDDQLQVWDGSWLRESPLEAALPLPAEQVVGQVEHLWLQAGGRLFHHTDGLLSSVELEGGADVQQLVPGPGSICAVMAPFLLVLDGFGGSVSLLDYQPDRRATSMTFDADGDLWLVDGTTRLQRRAAAGDWGMVTADEELLSVHGHPGAEDVWLRTPSGALHHHNGRFHRVELPEGDWLGVDPLGRLLLRGPDELLRVSTRRSVAVSGLRAGAQLDASVRLAFAPTGPDSLLSLEVWVGTDPLLLDPELGTVDLDPVALPPGAHLLRMAAVGPEGTTLTDLPFRTGELPEATWESDIEPIMQEHCSRCHGEGAGIPLHTADQWRLSIDRILVEVVTQDMPLGGPYLSDDELALVRGWQAGGFQ